MMHRVLLGGPTGTRPSGPELPWEKQDREIHEAKVAALDAMARVSDVAVERIAGAERSAIWNDAVDACIKRLLDLAEGHSDQARWGPGRLRDRERLSADALRSGAQMLVDVKKKEPT